MINLNGTRKASQKKPGRNKDLVMNWDEPRRNLGKILASNLEGTVEKTKIALTGVVRKNPIELVIFRSP